MSRRFTPLGLADLAEVGPACSGCQYWESDAPLEVGCGAACDTDAQRAWFARVHDEWGECGRAVREAEEVLGFIKYAPARYFPQARHLPVPPSDWSAPMIACMHIRHDARRLGLGRLLLHAALKDLHVRNQRSVYAYGYSGPLDIDTVPMPGVEFLLRNGFTIECAHPHFPLLRVELRTLASLGENLEAMLESLRIPLRPANRVPAPFIDTRGPSHV